MWITPAYSPIPIKSCCFLVTKLCPTLCNPMDCSTPGFPVLHYLPEFAQTNGQWIGDAIQPSHSPSPTSPPALNVSQHQDLFQWVHFSHQVAKILELQLQPQSFRWVPLGLTGLISFQSKGISRVFSSTRIWKHQLFGVQSNLCFNSHIHTWLLGKP